MSDLINTAPCGFFAFSDDGSIVEVNQMLTSMLGYARDELLGRHVEKLLPPGGRIFYHTYLFPLLKVQELVEEIYLALRSKDGTEIPVLLNGARRERGGKYVSDCVFLRMLRRHEYEDQLLHARRIAEESSAAKAKFLSMMSHDLRTPLTAIDGNAQLLATGVHGPLTSQQLEAVGAIREGCRAQMALIGDILEFARLDSGRVQLHTQPVLVSDIVVRAETLVRFQVDEAGLRMTTEGCCGNNIVEADPDRLQQVVLNLLTNAVKFTPTGGRIAIVCEKAGDRIRIHVRDTGIGISPEHLQRIFSPFVQVETADAVSQSAASRGVGLGLAISRDLARAMNGDVMAQSTPGAGSVFTIDLPAAPSHALARATR